MLTKHSLFYLDVGGVVDKPHGYVYQRSAGPLSVVPVGRICRANPIVFCEEYMRLFGLSIFNTALRAQLPGENQTYV